MRMKTKPRSRSGKKHRREVDIARMLIALGIEFRDRGEELWASCPSPKHRGDRTASWSIDEEGGHHCFGCGWQGGSLELVMRVVGLSNYAAADTYLEERGLYLDGALPLAVQLRITKAEQSTDMKFPPDARILPLAEWITPARRYAKERGITAGQVTRWGLGYATGGYYANRLLLPTHDRSGALLNITGRAWSKTKTPKYLNSKEAHGWDPGAIFGEQHWPEYQSRSTLVLCEGELNALACERREVPYIGALGGSQLEKEQVLKLGQFQRVILAVDMDKAGSKVARALRATLVRWRRCVTIKFPDHRDPNDLERRDPELLDRLLKTAMAA